MDKTKINRWHSVLLLLIGISGLVLGSCGIAGVEMPHGLLTIAVAQILVGLGLLYTSILKLKHKF